MQEWSFLFSRFIYVKGSVTEDNMVLKIDGRINKNKVNKQIINCLSHF